MYTSPQAGRGFNIAPAVKNNCKGLTTLHTMSERQRRLLYRHMVYDDVHKLMFCYVPKAGKGLVVCCVVMFGQLYPCYEYCMCPFAVLLWIC